MTAKRSSMTSATSSIKEIGKYTESALKSLVAASLMTQSEEFAILQKKSSSFGSYFDDFCTINLKTSRRSGHTTSMIWVAQEMFSDPLFVGVNKSIASNIVDSLVRVCEMSKRDARDMVFKISDFDRRGRGRKYDAVFVDCASLLNEKDREIVFDFAKCYAARLERFCLVLLG